MHRHREWRSMQRDLDPACKDGAEEAAARQRLGGAEAGRAVRDLDPDAAAAAALHVERDVVGVEVDDHPEDHLLREPGGRGLHPDNFPAVAHADVPVPVEEDRAYVLDVRALDLAAEDEAHAVRRPDAALRDLVPVPPHAVAMELLLVQDRQRGQCEPPAVHPVRRIHLHEDVPIFRQLPNGPRGGVPTHPVHSVVDGGRRDPREAHRLLEAPPVVARSSRGLTLRTTRLFRAPSARRGALRGPLLLPLRAALLAGLARAHPGPTVASLPRGGRVGTLCEVVRSPRAPARRSGEHHRARGPPGPRRWPGPSRFPRYGGRGRGHAGREGRREGRRPLPTRGGRPLPSPGLGKGQAVAAAAASGRRHSGGGGRALSVQMP
mmetsp:Transcript_50449/g.156062  ORF Transcript_50449/g.156062 Transcript_50449/m.156062 type:complete len:378 (+) Transcript_50449:224-1357(+)